MAKKIFGSLELRTQSAILFTDADSSNSVSLRSPAVVTTNLTLTLPASVVASGVLSTDVSGNLSAALLADANIDAAAAISLGKLASLTASRALVSDGSGVVSASTVTTTEIEYVSGVTSAIQTQLNDKLEASDITGKASTALDNLSVASLAAQSILVGSSGTAVSSLAAGAEGQVLKVVGGVLAWAADAAGSTFKDDWETADTDTFAITHNLDSKDIMVQIYDKATDETIEIDSVVRTSVNVVTLTASEAPGIGGWRVLITAV